MKGSLQRQQGWTFTGLLITLIVAGIFATVAFKLAPAYNDHHTMVSIMQDTIADRQLLSQKNNEIELSISRRMRLNNMRDLPKDYYKITRDKGTVTINVDYEVRIPIFMNVDAVVSFKDKYEGKELE